jgi:hypothetical protein
MAPSETDDLSRARKTATGTVRSVNGPEEAQ